MAWEGPHVLKLTGLTASADLSAKQYHYVKMSGEKTVTVTAAVTDVPVGVLQNNPTSGQEAEIVCIGVTKVVGDEDLAAGDIIGTSNDGQAQKVVVGTETTVYITGQVLNGNGAAGGIATAVINCAAPARAA